MGVGTSTCRYRAWGMGSALLAILFLSLPVSAHLMVAQKGTLKLGKGGYFFVVSLPVSAVAGIDDDGDGLLSAKEMRTHGETIKSAIRAGFVLESDVAGPRVIEGLLLNRAHRHSRAKRPASHIVAMGRFSAEPEDVGLVLRTSLFGKAKNEQRFEIAITRDKRKEVAVLTKEQPTHPLYAGR
jgi:hypothetical protein